MPRRSEPTQPQRRANGVMPGHKSVQYAYASSPDAVKYGCGKTGCYLIYGPNDEAPLIKILDEDLDAAEKAFKIAAKIAAPWDRFSQRQGPNAIDIMTGKALGCLKCSEGVMQGENRATGMVLVCDACGYEIQEG